MRVDDPLRGNLVNRSGEQCEYCHYPEHFSPSSFEVEHIVPRSAGGTTEMHNLAIACSHCNAHKAARQTGYDPVTETNVRLFNPRIDNWSVHLYLNRKNGEIQGQTPIGRATVITLQMNVYQPIRARLNLIKLGIL